MNFKDFLLKEDPDGVGETMTYDDKDALSVILFKNCYLYAPTREYTHENMFLSIYLNNVTTQDLNELDEEKRNIITTSIQHKNELFPTEIKQIGLLKGNIKKKIIKEFNSTIQYGNFSQGLGNYIVYDKVILQRAVILRLFPETLLARVWTDRKVISFWNVGSSVISMKNDVYSFLRSLNHFVRTYKYEIDGNLVNYEDFNNGKFNSTELDVSKVHTMSPELKGAALRKMGVSPKAPLDIKIKMLTKSSD